MTRPVFLLFLVCFSNITIAQVANDDIENKQLLLLEEIHHSKTDNCTVQWECVDERLTGKCIDYHNDQWFYFNSGANRKLFLNIMNQKCRDLKGVQIVVIQGEPCNTSSYNVLTCVSLATQDDVYIELDSLVLYHDYLINIDGYLHDYCSFEIEVSSSAKGLPTEQTMDLITDKRRTGKMIQIDWALPDSLQFEIQEFRIFKRIHPEFKSELAQSIPVAPNAYGEFPNQYSFYDSLRLKQRYYYQLTALCSDNKLYIIDKYEFQFSGESAPNNFKKEIAIPLGNVKSKTSFSLIIQDFYSMEVLFHKQFDYKRKGQQDYIFYTWSLANKGVTKIFVEVINNKTKSRMKHVYDLLQ